MERTSDAPHTGPLAGIRVVDLTSVFLGPTATQFLADLGADVIKVESPRGDVTRFIGTQADTGMGPHHLALNRNKRSLVLDLKTAGGREVVQRLIDASDVFVHNIRPAAIHRLGLEYEEVRALNPRIVYAELVGFSQAGPYGPLPAYDELIQAASGLSATAGAQGDPIYAPAALADRSVGMLAFGAIAAALYARERTGASQHVTVPMFETMVSVVLGDHLYGETYVPAHGPIGYPRILSPQRHPYRTLDGHIAVTVYTDDQWTSFLRTTGHGDLVGTDPRLADITTRLEYIDELYQLVADILLTKSTHDWLELLQDADVPCSRVHTLETLQHDPHLTSTGFIHEVEHPVAGTIRQLRQPLEWQDHVAPEAPAPVLGEHTSTILTNLGYSAPEIETLLASGAAVTAQCNRSTSQ